MLLEVPYGILTGVTSERGSSPEDVQPDPLVWLQAWYATQCDGDWEHGFGILIETLDNPGWRLQIDLDGTTQQFVPFDRVEEHRAEHDWYVAWVDGSSFHAACGPLNLGEAIHVFRTWCRTERASNVSPPT